MLLVIYAKIVHHNFIPTIYENFKSFFYLSRAKEYFETCIPVLFQQLKQRIKAVLRYFHWTNNILINGQYLKNAKYHVW